MGSTIDYNIETLDNTDYRLTFTMQLKKGPMLEIYKTARAKLSKDKTEPDLPGEIRIPAQVHNRLKTALYPVYKMTKKEVEDDGVILLLHWNIISATAKQNQDGYLATIVCEGIYEPQKSIKKGG